MLGDLAAAGVDEIGDLLKREERDAERQDDVLQEKIGPHQGVGSIDQEIGVFEIAEHHQIDGDPEDQQQANPTGPAGRRCAVIHRATMKLNTAMPPSSGRYSGFHQA